MPGLVMIGPVVWAVGELYTHERYYFIYIDLNYLCLITKMITFIKTKLVLMSLS